MYIQTECIGICIHYMYNISLYIYAYAHFILAKEIMILCADFVLAPCSCLFRSLSLYLPLCFLPFPFPFSSYVFLFASTRGMYFIFIFLYIFLAEF